MTARTLVLGVLAWLGAGTCGAPAQSSDAGRLALPSAEAVFARYQSLLRSQDREGAERLLRELLKGEALAPALRRKALVALAGQIMWGRADEAKQCLDQAATIPAGDLDEWVQASITRGYVYLIQRQPENALEVWLPILERRDPVHPAHLSSVSHQIGLVYRQLGDPQSARKYFRLAVDYGKSVRYPFDYSASEKALVPD